MPALMSPAPAWRTEQWFNSAPLEVGDLAGRPVALYAFQMLCPGCVSHALPQALRVRESFAVGQLAVIGLHTVFEHHDANSPEALGAFLKEYRIGFPVGLDSPGPERRIPQTMTAYNMQGTPTLVLIDARGRFRRRFFGHLPDLRLGAEIAALLGEAAPPTGASEPSTSGVCAVP